MLDELSPLHKAGADGLRRQFPMYVLPVQAVLQLKSLRTHEELFEQLVTWEPGMAPVAFISHTWLQYACPDKGDVKARLLTALLRKAVDGKLDIHPHWTTESIFGQLDIKACTLQKDLLHGFVWLDVRAMPSTPDRMPPSPPRPAAAHFERAHACRSPHLTTQLPMARPPIASPPPPMISL